MGTKEFINKTPYPLDITLYIRKSANPKDQAGTQDFSLAVHESKRVSYGDNINIYLNGIQLTAIFNGQIFQQTEFVITRGSYLDNQFNMNNTVKFQFDGKHFSMAVSNK